ncbi:MAG: hypothetical protein ACON5F_07395 [Jejuia sp.]
MKKVVICIFCVASMGYIAIPKNAIETNTSPEKTTKCKTYVKPSSHETAYKFMNSFEPYNIYLNLKPVKDDVFNLVIDMRLNNSAYFVSPNAKRDFSGKFTFMLKENSQLSYIGTLSENPLSIEEHDPHPFVNGTVNWVRQNTVYTQKLKINTDEDFVVNGFIQFTIEPKCTLEKIPVVIYREKDVLKFEIDNC